MRNFKPEDFDGSGQYLIRNDGEPNTLKDSGYMSTITYKVGYSHGHGFTSKPDKGNIVLLVSMADGWTQSGYFDKHGKEDPEFWTFSQWNSKQDFCNWLNTKDQEMRFATQEEIVRVVLYQKGRWHENPK